MSLYKPLYLVFFLCLIVVACKENDHSDNLTSTVRQLIADKKIEPLYLTFPVASIHSNVAQLGKQLFFSKALSGSLDTACGSCHHPLLGGGDGLSLSIGVSALDPDLLGLERRHDPNAEQFDGGPTIPRNSPTTFNVAFYQRVLFHDGRIENNDEWGLPDGTSLRIRTPDVVFGQSDEIKENTLVAAQARFPVISQEEMKGFHFQQGQSNSAIRNALIKRLQGKKNELEKNGWFEAFQMGFQDHRSSMSTLITFDNVTFALGEYQRSQIFIDNPWFRFLQGDDAAISDSAKRGSLLFYQDKEEGGLMCHSCHSGSFFTDEKFHVLAVPQIGRGKGDGAFGDDDFGRFRETQRDQDKYAYRTPSLLNVTRTEPWGHSGAFVSLSDVIAHHLNARASIDKYEPRVPQIGIQARRWQENTQLAWLQLVSLRLKGQSLLFDSPYTEQNLIDLISFLTALEDPCTRQFDCLQPWLTSEKDIDPDNLSLDRLDPNHLPKKLK